MPVSGSRCIDVENVPPVDDDGTISAIEIVAKGSGGGGGGGPSSSEKGDKGDREDRCPSRRSSSKKNHSGQRFSSRILLCAGGSGSGSGLNDDNGSCGHQETKRKEVEEANLPSVSSDASNLHQTSRGRKSSRKGSKKKTKEPSLIPMHPLDEKGNKTSPNESSPSHHTLNEGGGCDSNSTTQQQHPNKSCCLCWCCCCPCSGLSVKNPKGHKDGGKHEMSQLEHFLSQAGNSISNSGPQDPIKLPPIDQIKGWGETFDKLMKCPCGRIVFGQFLKCEYSEENILFWAACEELKLETDEKVIEDKCRQIYEEFISILSPKEVSLDSKAREVINQNMMNPCKETFIEAQMQIYTLMMRDSYPRFVNSSTYKQLIGQEVTEPQSNSVTG